MTGYKEAVMKKYGPDKMENLGFAYDLHSIMQYGKHAFAKSENLLTMEARSNPNMELGNHDAMSAADIMKVNKLYQCAERTDECKYNIYPYIFSFSFCRTRLSLYYIHTSLPCSISRGSRQKRRD